MWHVRACFSFPNHKCAYNILYILYIYSSDCSHRPHRIVFREHGRFRNTPPLGPLAPIFSHCGVSSGPGIDLRSAGDVACRAQHGLGGLGGCQQPNAGIRLTPHGANLLASGVPAEDFAGTSSGWNLLLKSAVMHW